MNLEIAKSIYPSIFLIISFSSNIETVFVLLYFRNIYISSDWLPVSRSKNPKWNAVTVAKHRTLHKLIYSIIKKYDQKFL